MTAVSCAIETPRFEQEWEVLRTGWNAMLARDSAGVEALDFTASFEWALTLWQTHWNTGEVEIVVLREGATIVGILPLYRFGKSVRRIPCRMVAPIWELYSGRTGFLLRTLAPEYLRLMFSTLRTQVRPWDLLSLTVVQGSQYERLFHDMAAAAGLRAKPVENFRSPYIPLQDSWEKHFASLPKKLRSTIRNGEKRLRASGEVAYRECRTPEDAIAFNAAVAQIERDSWKEAAGTSIAANPVHEAFHQCMTVRAAESGAFSGHLLLLNQEPIAYVMGTLYNGVFLDLKESYRNSLREMSPGHALKNFVFPKLIEQKATVYDFMGQCEDYKMKWTDKTYRRTTYLLFNDTIRAKAASWLSGSRSVHASDIKGSAAVSGHPNEESNAASDTSGESHIDGTIRV
jgi:CelD/BcsL family acetyltransferase involved in cellulose biosynthesis